VRIPHGSWRRIRRQANIPSKCSRSNSQMACAIFCYYLLNLSYILNWSTLPQNLYFYTSQ
jgi:hypothetical protein